MKIFDHLRKGIAEGGSQPMPSARPIRTSLRAAHVLAFGALFGGHVFAVEAERLVPALLAVIVTGTLFMAFEIWRAPIWLVQVRGVATYGKLVLLLCIPAFWPQRVWILAAIVVIGTVVSHMPSKYRYWSLLHRREVHGGAKG